jgi:hypothetical protein
MQASGALFRGLGQGNRRSAWGQAFLPTSQHQFADSGTVRTVPSINFDADAELRQEICRGCDVPLSISSSLMLLMLTSMPVPEGIRQELGESVLDPLVLQPARVVVCRSGEKDLLHHHGVGRLSGVDERLHQIVTQVVRLVGGGTGEGEENARVDEARVA